MVLRYTNIVSDCIVSTSQIAILRLKKVRHPQTQGTHLSDIKECLKNYLVTDLKDVGDYTLGHFTIDDHSVVEKSWIWILRLSLRNH